MHRLKSLAALLWHYKKLTGSLLLALSAFAYFHQRPVAPPMPDKVVETIEVEPQPIAQTIELIGTIHPRRSTLLSAKSSGSLDIYVPAGEQVQKGALLAKIINPDLEKSHQISVDEEKIAQSQYERMVKLRSSGIVSAREIEEKKQLWLEAQRKIALSQIDLNNNQFVAPFAGIVGVWKAKEGSQVQAGETLVSLYDPADLLVDIDLPCGNIPQVKVKQSAIIFDQTWPISQVQNMMDEQTHMCPANIAIRCDHCLIGSTVAVKLVLQAHEQALQVPAAALFLRQGKAFVYRVEKDSTVLTPVKTGIESEERVEITEGLKPGDVVISKAPERLYPGMRVTVLKVGKTGSSA